MKAGNKKNAKIDFDFFGQKVRLWKMINSLDSCSALEGDRCRTSTSLVSSASASRGRRKRRQSTASRWFASQSASATVSAPKSWFLVVPVRLPVSEAPLDLGRKTIRRNA